MATFNKTISDVKDAILTKFNTEWDNLTPVTYDNLDHNITYNTDWVRISVRVTGASVSALGQINYRNTGIIFIQIFQISGQSTSNTDVYVNKIVESMSQIQLENYITLRDVEMNGFNINQDTNGVYYQTNLSIQFYYDASRL